MLYLMVDLDGTICDSVPRVKELCKELGVDSTSDVNFSWTDEQMRDFLSEEKLLQDGVVPGAERLLEFADRIGAQIIFLTGRNEYCRNATRKWLIKNFGKRVAGFQLLMRPPELYGAMYTSEAKEQMFLNWRDAPWRASECVLGKTPDRFIFLEDEDYTVEKYSKYGLVLQAPQCWEAIK